MNSLRVVGVLFCTLAFDTILSSSSVLAAGKAHLLAANQRQPQSYIKSGGAVQEPQSSRPERISQNLDGTVVHPQNKNENIQSPENVPPPVNVVPQESSTKEAPLAQNQTVAAQETPEKGSNPVSEIQGKVLTPLEINVRNIVQGEDNAFKRVTQDYLAYTWFIEELRNQNDVVFLSSFGKPFGAQGSFISSPQEDFLLDVLVSLNANRKVLVYDLDSPLGESIQNQLKLVLSKINSTAIPLEERAEIQANYDLLIHSIGISASWDRARNSITPAVAIENHYLRFDAISALPHLICTPDSPLALGLLLKPENRKKLAILDLSASWNDPLLAWSKTLKASVREMTGEYSREKKKFVFKLPLEDLGLAYYDNVSTLSRVEQFESFLKRDQHQNSLWGNWNGYTYQISSKSQSKQKLSREELSKKIKDPLYELDVALVSHAWNKISHWVERKNKLDFVEEKFSKNNPNGKFAVFFGAKKKVWHYQDLLVSALLDLKNAGFQAIATGAGGGLMDIVSEIAYKEEMISIGISINPGSLFGETSEGSRYRHYTLATEDYAERIPFLLQNKSIILVGPGGEGTMKELSTAIFALSANPSTVPPILFLSQEYYGKFLEWVMKQPFSQDFKQKLQLYSGQ